MSAVNLVNFWSSKSLHPDPDRYQMNTDPQPWLCGTVYRNGMEIIYKISVCLLCLRKQLQYRNYHNVHTGTYQQDKLPIIPVYVELFKPDLMCRKPVGKTFGATVDLWSIGVTCYHVATGISFHSHVSYRHRTYGRNDKITLIFNRIQYRFFILSDIQVRELRGAKFLIICLSKRTQKLFRFLSFFICLCEGLHLIAML